MAPNDILHFLHCLWLPYRHVESGASASLGCRMRLCMGPDIERTSWSSIMDWNDGAPLPHGGC